VPAPSTRRPLVAEPGTGRRSLAAAVRARRAERLAASLRRELRTRRNGQPAPPSRTDRVCGFISDVWPVVFVVGSAVAFIFLLFAAAMGVANDMPDTPAPPQVYCFGDNFFDAECVEVPSN